jgi:O-antigen/teichoic acid export membrane protein
VTSQTSLRALHAEPHFRRDLNRFMLSLAPAGTAALLQLAVFVLTARALAPEVFGRLAGVNAVSVIAADIAGLGADAAIVRATAGRPAVLPRAWGHALMMTAFSFGPVVIAATGLAAWLTAPDLAVATVAALVAGEVLIGRTAATTEIAMIACADPVRASLVRLATAGARALVAILIFGFLRSTSPSLWAVATLAQSVLLSAVLLLTVRRLYGPPVLRPDTGSIVFGLLLMVNNLARTIGSTLDRIVLSAILPPLQLGLYASASRPLLLGGILIQAVTRIYHPRFFVAATAGQDALRSVTRRMAAALALIGVLAALMIACLAQLLPLLLGSAYSEAAGLGGLLAAAVPFIALQYPPADALTAIGRQGLRTGIYLVATLAGVLLLSLLAVVAGVWGAVLAFVLTQAALAAALWAVVLRTATA